MTPIILLTTKRCYLGGKVNSNTLGGDEPPLCCSFLATLSVDAPPLETMSSLEAGASRSTRGDNKLNPATSSPENFTESTWPSKISLPHKQCNITYFRLNLLWRLVVLTYVTICGEVHNMWVKKLIVMTIEGTAYASLYTLNRCSAFTRICKELTVQLDFFVP